MYCERPGGSPGGKHPTPGIGSTGKDLSVSRVRCFLQKRADGRAVCEPGCRTLSLPSSYPDLASGRGAKKRSSPVANVKWASSSLYLGDPWTSQPLHGALAPPQRLSHRPCPLLLWLYLVLWLISSVDDLCSESFCLQFRECVNK